MPSYKTEAIILSRFNLGEADRILTLFSKHYGKIKALGKGVRKPTSRKGGSLDQFNQVKLVLAKGRNLDIITEVELVDFFGAWRKNLVRVGVAYYSAELVERLTPEGQASQEVFYLLRDFLAKLDRGNLISLIREFEEALLTISGFGVPESLREAPGSLSDYIEGIIEKKLKSKEVLEKIKYG